MTDALDDSVVIEKITKAEQLVREKVSRKQVAEAISGISKKMVTNGSFAVGYKLYFKKIVEYLHGKDIPEVEIYSFNTI